MSNKELYKGSCFCGAVEFTVSGEPAGMGYCHCESCRHWSAGPVNAFTLWSPEAVKVTQGADNIGTYNKTPQSSRKWCKNCGGHIFTSAASDVYKRQVHVNYQESVLHVRDGLPKMKDMPEEMGGSGDTLPE